MIAPEKKTFKGLLENQILTTFIVFIFISLIIFASSYYYFRHTPDEYIKSILIEAHGMVLDLFVIGILLFWLNKAGEKQIDIKRNHDDIDDIRFWKSEEANFKIQGSIKRLLRYGVHKINLQSCYLKNIKLNYSDVSFSNFNYADLSFGSFIETDFTHAQMNQAKLENTNLNKSNFHQAILNGVNFVQAHGVKTNFSEAKLIKANFSHCHLIDANFQGAELAGADFDNSSLYMPDFTNAVGLSAEQFAEVKVLVKPKFDKELETEILEKFPHIVKKRFMIET